MAAWWGLAWLGLGSISSSSEGRLVGWLYGCMYVYVYMYVGDDGWMDGKQDSYVDHGVPI